MNRLSECLCQSYAVVVVIMASKLRLPSQKDIERLLEDSASGDDDVSLENDKCSEFESDSDCEIEDPQSSDCDTTPPAQKISKGEGWEWSVTGDRPSICILQEILG